LERDRFSAVEFKTITDVHGLVGDSEQNAQADGSPIDADGVLLYVSHV